MSDMHMQKQFIVGVSGASGALYAENFIKNLAMHVPGKSALIVSDAALRVYREEIHPSVRTADDYRDALLENLPSERKHHFEIYSSSDIGAPPASGSSSYEAMIILPCSMKTLSAVSHGHASNLLERAADACIKERKKLILVPRETPYSSIHLQNMLNITHAGAVILPASPGFYHKPKSLEDLAVFLTSKIFHQLGIQYAQSIIWEGDHETA